MKRHPPILLALRVAGGVAAFVVLRWLVERKPMTADPVELLIVAAVAVALSLRRPPRNGA